MTIKTALSVLVPAVIIIGAGQYFLLQKYGQHDTPNGYAIGLWLVAAVVGIGSGFLVNSLGRKKS